MKKWDSATITWVDRHLRNNSTLAGAVLDMQNAGWESLTVDALTRSYKRLTGRSPGTLLVGAKPDLTIEPREKVRPGAEPTLVGSIPELLKYLKRGVGDIPSLADALDCSPAKVRLLIERAHSEGYAVRFEADSVGLGEVPSGRVEDTGIPPVSGGWFKLGVMSDLHSGSRYCMWPQIRDCVDTLYRAGVRHIASPGDLLQGIYGHSQFELSSVGVEAQTAELLRRLPARPDLHYHFITGNHDETFTDANGLSTGRFLVRAGLERGRKDLHFYGDRAAKIRIGGTVVDMWHPKGKGAYALSYNLQKRIEDYGSGEKPGILLVGHFHKAGYIDVRGVHGMLCPCFQSPGSAFSNSLVGKPVNGGLLLKWRVTDNGTIRDFVYRSRRYFVHEQPKEIQ